MLIIANYGRPQRPGYARPLPRKEVAVTVDFSTQRATLQSTGAQKFSADATNFHNFEQRAQCETDILIAFDRAHR